MGHNKQKNYRDKKHILAFLFYGKNLRMPDFFIILFFSFYCLTLVSPFIVCPLQICMGKKKAPTD